MLGAFTLDYLKPKRQIISPSPAPPIPPPYFGDTIIRLKHLADRFYFPQSCCSCKHCLDSSCRASTCSSRTTVSEPLPWIPHPNWSSLHADLTYFASRWIRHHVRPLPLVRGGRSRRLPRPARVKVVSPPGSAMQHPRHARRRLADNGAPGGPLLSEVPRTDWPPRSARSEVNENTRRQRERAMRLNH